MSKSKKSVERQKPKKKEHVKEPIADIIAVKQPLSKGGQNINKNTQNVIIQFPNDVELKKVKKKKKSKPRDNKRKQLLEQLKSELENYDNIQAEVRKKNIKIPTNLGLTMISTSQLKTNDDILKFIQDVALKTEGLKKLLNPEIEQRIATPQTNLPNRFGIQEAVRYIQPATTATATSTQQPFIGVRPWTPSQPTQTSSTYDPLKDLKDIEKEVSDRIGGDTQLPPKPSTPEPSNATSSTGGTITTGGMTITGIPTIPVEMEEYKRPSLSDLSTIKGAIVGGHDTMSGGDPIDLVAPLGWYTLYHKWEKYQADIGYNDRKRFTIGNPEDNFYHIPLNDYNRIMKQRNTLRDEYRIYINQLPRDQLNYLLTGPVVAPLHLAMMNGLNQEPKLILAEQLKKQGLPYNEITQGNEQPARAIAIQKSKFKDPALEKQREDFELYISSKTTDLTQLKTEIEQKQRGGQVLSQEEKQTKLNKVYAMDTDINNKFEKLPPDIQIDARVGYDKFIKRSNDVISIINSGSIFDPVASSVPREETEKIKRTAIKDLIDYVEDTATGRSKKKFTIKMKENIREYLGGNVLNKLETKRGDITQFKRELVNELKASNLPYDSMTYEKYLQTEQAKDSI
tara:strand:- start:1089 stop:2963 length:1875 start_codon:yes stop_codon:yes gene_type:complete